MLPNPEWIIDDILPAQGLAVLVGAPGLGKTFQALDWSFRIATRQRLWANREVQPGPVVYVAAEGFAGLPLRVQAWKRRHGFTGLAGVRFMQDVVNLLEPNHVSEFLQALSQSAIQPRLIVIDTLARSMPGGDENSSQHMGRLVEQADLLRKSLHATVLLLHHPTKAGGTERGSGALRGAAETLITLEKKKGQLILTCGKQKDSDQFKELPVVLEHVQLDCGLASCVMVPKGECSGVTALDDSRQSAVDALGTFPNHRATFGEWQHAGDIAERSLHRIAITLVANGIVCRPNGKRGPYQLTDKGAATMSRSAATQEA